MSLVALVNTTNHLFVRREPLISTRETHSDIELLSLAGTLSGFVALRGQMRHFACQNFPFQITGECWQSHHCTAFWKISPSSEIIKELVLETNWFAGLEHFHRFLTLSFLRLTVLQLTVVYDKSSSEARVHCLKVYRSVVLCLTMYVLGFVEINDPNDVHNFFLLCYGCVYLFMSQSRKFAGDS